jgi:hypothetical protein
MNVEDNDKKVLAKGGGEINSAVIAQNIIALAVSFTFCICLFWLMTQLKNAAVAMDAAQSVTAANIIRLLSVAIAVLTLVGVIFKYKSCMNTAIIIYEDKVVGKGVSADFNASLYRYRPREFCLTYDQIKSVSVIGNSILDIRANIKAHRCYVNDAQALRNIILTRKITLEATAKQANTGT